MITSSLIGWKSSWKGELSAQSFIQTTLSELSVFIAKSKAEAKISKNVLREGADYYILTEMDDQVFPSGVSKKITPKLYKLKDTEIYIFFSFPPFLFDADNGMIEIKDNKGTFFKKPTQ